MNNPNAAPPSDDEALALIDLKAILDWLATPVAAEPKDELAPLHAHLTALRETQTAAHQRHKVFDLLYARAYSAIVRLVPELKESTLPLSRRTRQTVRGMQDILRMVAEDYLHTLDDLDERLIKGLRRPRELTLWRAIDALAQHLLISNFVAAPPAPGIWQMLHGAFDLARHEGYAEATPTSAEISLREVYLRALLLASAQPASFTANEISLAVDFIRRFGHRVTIVDGTDEPLPEHGVFWVDPTKDAPPTAATRRPPPGGALLFSCEPLAELADEEVTALSAGVPPDQLDLPETAATASGHGVLRRLAHYWGQPAKRRFPRRRQSYRAVLCAGLETLWSLFNESQTQLGELSSWMVTNESPDGYALMHLSGKTSKLAAGDIVALRTENSEDWQVCIVRWALSENPEHLELGLQILATRATPAIVAFPAHGDTSERQPGLVLPQLLPLRPAETLIVRSGASRDGLRRMVLLIEQGNLEVREVRATHLDEQTSSIEVVGIVPDDMSGLD